MVDLNTFLLHTVPKQYGQVGGYQMSSGSISNVEPKKVESRFVFLLVLPVRCGLQVMVPPKMLSMHFLREC